MADERDSTISGTREPSEETALVLLEIVESTDATALHGLVAACHAEDLADVVETLPEEHLGWVLSTLEPADAASLMEALAAEHRSAAASIIPADVFAEVLDALPSDTAADIIGDLEPEQARELLHLMEDEESADVELLLTYPADSAGGLMVAEVIALTGNLTVDDTINRLRNLHLDTQVPYYVFVIDHLGKLLGVVSLRMLLASAGAARLNEVMTTPVITARTDDDQELVAQKMRRYNLAALPVVDDQGYLRGAVTVDDAMDVIETELEEDFFRFAGSNEPTETESGPVMAAWYRLPVVLACLVGDVWAGYAVLKYEHQLTELAALAAFLPALMATGGNIGQQSLATVIRAIASGERATPALFRAVARESSVGLMMGVVSGLVLGGICFLWLRKLPLAILLATSLTITSLIAAVLGAAVPLTLERLGRDPAIASGPLITTLNDIISTTLYFAMAVAMLSWLGG